MPSRTYLFLKGFIFPKFLFSLVGVLISVSKKVVFGCLEFPEQSINVKETVQAKETVLERLGYK
jgi:hypothetical protein